MEWLLDNPLANMFGPMFLLVYAVLIVTLIVLHRYKITSLDWTKKLPLPQIPANPDPYEIAYLRGGENEVIRSVIFALVQRGYLIHTKDFMEKQATFSKSGKIDGIHSLNAMERNVLYYFSEPKDAGEIFKSGVSDVVSSHCLAYEGKLLNEQLLTPPEIKSAAQRNAGIAAAVILAIGGFKFVAAVTHGRFNVVFLIIMAIVGLIVLFVTTSIPRLSHRGRAYLEALQTAFSNLSKKTRVGDKNKTLQPSTTFAGVDPLLLMVGVFGVGSLIGTDYGYFEESFQKSAMNNSASTSGCGSGTSCGSSSCSSGGGDGGGGGCGGGGCGGGCGG
jgi:uncharacterized protein (TIGR04222 family)